MKSELNFSWLWVLIVPREAWTRAADLVEAYQIGKWESQAAFRLLNDVPDEIVQKLMGQVQWPVFDLAIKEWVLLGSIKYIAVVPAKALFHGQIPHPRSGGGRSFQ